MRSKLLLLISCVLLAACAAQEDIKETGISRERAISIAKTSCKEYPDRFGFVGNVDWIPEKKYWAVQLEDRSGDNGRVYKINRKGNVIGTRNYTANDDYGPGPGPYRRGWWY